MPNHYHLVWRKSKMKNSRRNILILIILAAAAFSGCTRKEGKPHEVPRARPPDISKAVEIPGVPYPVIPNEFIKEGQTTTLEAGDYGKNFIGGKTPGGGPVKA